MAKVLWPTGSKSAEQHLMNRHEQIDALVFEMNNLINRHVAEFDLDTHTIVGVLEDMKMELLLTGLDSIDFESDADTNAD